MFSGIVQAVGIIKIKIADNLQIKTKQLAHKVVAGSSVCVSGVCLTVTRIAGETLHFDVSPETLRKTNLGEKKVGDRVNLETSLHVGDEISGHLVYGHVDGVSEVLAAGDKIDIEPPKALMQYIVPQGSVAIDGVSLTVAGVEGNKFSVSLVPYTRAHTTLGALRARGRVNVEVDMLARYAAGRFLSS